MKILLLLLVAHFTISCNKNNVVTHLQSNVGITKTNRQIIKIDKPSVIVIEFDSVQLERLRKIDEENFYTAADDVMHYNALLVHKMDSLNIPVFRSEKDTVYVQTPNDTFQILKDTSQAIHEYYYFDGKKISKQDVFDLLDR
jgi:hypothetical protein